MAVTLWKPCNIRKNCKALNEEEYPRTLKGEIFMEENMELTQVKEDLASLTDEERDLMQKLISAMIVGVFHSIDENAVIENVKKQMENVVGEECTDDDLVEAFGEDGITDIVDTFKGLTVDNIANVMEQIGLNTFADVGYLIEQGIEPEKLTAGEE